MAALPPLSAEVITTIGSFPVTNAYINSVLTVIGFVIFAYIINRAVQEILRQGLAPRGILNFFESILESLFGYFDQVTGSRQKTIRFPASCRQLVLLYFDIQLARPPAWHR